MKFTWIITAYKWVKRIYPRLKRAYLAWTEKPPESKEMPE